MISTAIHKKYGSGKTVENLTEGMVDLFVARIIDLLTDGKVDLFVFESTGRTVQYKLNAQSLRLIGLHSDVNDAHRAGANRLKKTNKHAASSSSRTPWRRALRPDVLDDAVGHNMSSVADCLQQDGRDCPTYHNMFEKRISPVLLTLVGVL